MMEHLTPILSKSLEDALLRCSKALGQLTCKIIISKTLIPNGADSKEVWETPSQSELVFVTKLHGNLSGYSLLAIDQTKVDTIARSLSHGLMISFEPTNLELKQSVLLELDNILSAAFLSELADQWKVSTYGGVPQLFQPDEFKVWLKDMETKFSNPFSFFSQMSCKDGSFDLKMSFVFDKATLPNFSY